MYWNLLNRKLQPLHHVCQMCCRCSITGVLHFSIVPARMQDIMLFCSMCCKAVQCSTFADPVLQCGICCKAACLSSTFAVLIYIFETCCMCASPLYFPIDHSFSTFTALLQIDWRCAEILCCNWAILRLQFCKGTAHK